MCVCVCQRAQDEASRGAFLCLLASPAMPALPRKLALAHSLAFLLSYLTLARPPSCFLALREEADGSGEGMLPSLSCVGSGAVLSDFVAVPYAQTEVTFAGLAS